MKESDNKRNYNKRDIKRILAINDPSFFALACNSLEEAIISDWYCKKNKISKRAYKDEFRGLFDAIQYVREYTTGAEDEKFDALLNSIQKKKDDINAIRHDFFSIAYDHAMGYGSDLLEFVDSFKRKFSCSGISDEDLTDFKNKIEERRNSEKYLQETRDYFSLNKINVKKLMEVEEDNRLLSNQIAETNAELERTRKAKAELSKKIDSLDAKNDDLRQENFDIKESRRKEKEAYEQQISEYNKTIDVCTAKIEDLNKQLEENPISQEDLFYIREVSGFSINRRKYEKSIMKLTPEQNKVVAEVDVNEDTYINGGAGTGKTLVLIKLIEKILKSSPNASFVFIAFTNTLVNYLRYIAPMLSKDIAEKIEKNSITANAFLNTQNYNRWKLKYDYVFVDEIQDFSTNQLKIFKSSARRSLIFSGDTNQAIYGKGGNLRVAGITDYRMYSLHKNFRSTIQISALAEEYKKLVIKNQEGEADSYVLDKASSSSCSIRDGMPVKCSIVGEDLASVIANRIKQILDLGEYDENSICVLTSSKEEAYNVYNFLKKKYQVSFYKDKDNKRHGLNFHQHGIKILTVHSAKGIDFPYVLFCSNGLSEKQDGKINNYELVYTAITRATDRLEVFINVLDFLYVKALSDLWLLLNKKSREESEE